MFKKITQIAIALTLSQSAFAVTFGNPGEVAGLNAFIFGNASTPQGGHALGSVVVGGDWTGSSYEIKQHSSTPVPGAPFGANTGLYLGGANNVSNYLRVLNGNAYLPGAANTLNVQKGAVFTQTLDLDSSISDFKQLSTDLFALQSETLNTSDMNNVKVDVAKNNANGALKVFNVDAASLTGNRTLDFLNFDSTSELILINVTGKLVDWKWSTNVDPTAILWNFSATTINITERHFFGSILAPNASVSQWQNIDGTLIANEWNVYNSVQLHSFPFQGFKDLPPPVEDPKSGTPVPDGGSSLLLSGLGVGALFVAKRKSQKKTAA